MLMIKKRGVYEGVWLCVRKCVASSEFKFFRNSTYELLYRNDMAIKLLVKPKHFFIKLFFTNISQWHFLRTCLLA